MMFFIACEVNSWTGDAQARSQIEPICPKFQVPQNHRLLSKFHSNFIRGVYTTCIYIESW